MSDTLRDALVVVMAIGGCGLLLLGAHAVATWPRHPLPVPNCTHPVAFSDQPYCPTPVPTP